MARFEKLAVTDLKVKNLSTVGGPALVAKHATGIVDFDNVGVATETHIIGGITYTWGDAAAVTAAAQGGTSATAVTVLIGADAAGCATNLAAAINDSGTAGTTYSTGNSAHPDVSASIGFIDAAGDAVVVTARRAGAGGNAIVFTETGTNTVHYEYDGTTVATTLTNGVNGNNAQNDTNYTNISGYNSTVISGAAVGGATAGTTGATNMFTWKGEHFENFILGLGQTIIDPVPTVEGLDITGDAADNEGREIGQGILAGEKHAYQVGRDGRVALRVKFSIADVSDTDTCLLGFRKAEAYQADYNNYDELIGFNVNAGNIFGALIKNGAATDQDDLGDNWADGETHELKVVVGHDGTCTLTVDGAAPTTAHAGTLKFDGNETVVPFFHHLHAAASASGIVIKEWECGQVV